MEKTNKFKIFLVDDDSFCMGVYLQHLGNLGYRDVTGFDNGPECLNHLTRQPDVIFLDHDMNHLTGIEVLKKIKRFNPDIFVVFLSGQEMIVTAVNALKYGAFDYIEKGDFTLEKMTKVLTKIGEIKGVLKKENSSLINKLLSYL